MNLDEILSLSPYSLKKSEKEKLLTSRLQELTQYNVEHCSEYARILDVMGLNSDDKSYKSLPFIPVSLFKEFDMMSIHHDEIIKTMISSGTSGQKVSRIYLDKKTASAQQKALVKIVSDFTGAQRMPMIILDCPSVLKNRNMFSARGAGILGFSIFGTKKIYAFNDDDMELDINTNSEFLEKFKGEKFFLFGFIFMIWQYFYKKLSENRNIHIDLSNRILGCVHIKRASKIIASWITEMKIISNLS